MEIRLDLLSVMLSSVTACCDTEGNLALQQGSPSISLNKTSLCSCCLLAVVKIAFLSGLFGYWHLSDSVRTTQDQKGLKLRLSLARFLGILQFNFFFYLCNVSKKYFTIYVYIYILSIAVCQFSWKKSIWKLENSNSRVVFKGITLHHARPKYFIKVL